MTLFVEAPERVLNFGEMKYNDKKNQVYALYGAFVCFIISDFLIYFLRTPVLPASRYKKNGPTLRERIGVRRKLDIKHLDNKTQTITMYGLMVV